MECYKPTHERSHGYTQRPRLRSRRHPAAPARQDRAPWCRCSRSGARTSATSVTSARPCASSTRRSTPASTSSTTPGSTTTGGARRSSATRSQGKRDRVFLMTKVCTHGRDKQSRAWSSSRNRCAACAPTTSISGRSTSASTTTIPELHFAPGGVVEALERGEAAGQGALRRLHRAQGSGHPPDDAGARLPLRHRADAAQLLRRDLPQLRAAACCPEAPAPGIARHRDEEPGRRRRPGARRAWSPPRRRCATR